MTTFNSIKQTKEEKRSLRPKPINKTTNIKKPNNKTTEKQNNVCDCCLETKH
jgi:hypothetical protein